MSHCCSSCYVTPCTSLSNLNHFFPSGWTCLSHSFGFETLCHIRNTYSIHVPAHWSFSMKIWPSWIFILTSTHSVSTKGFCLLLMVVQSFCRSLMWRTPLEDCSESGGQPCLKQLCTLKEEVWQGKSPTWAEVLAVSRRINLFLRSTSSALYMQCIMCENSFHMMRWDTNWFFSQPRGCSLLTTSCSRLSFL